MLTQVDHVLVTDLDTHVAHSLDQKTVAVSVLAVTGVVVAAFVVVTVPNADGSCHSVARELQPSAFSPQLAAVSAAVVAGTDPPNWKAHAGGGVESVELPLSVPVVPAPGRGLQPAFECLADAAAAATAVAAAAASGGAPADADAVADDGAAVAPGLAAVAVVVVVAAAAAVAAAAVAAVAAAAAGILGSGRKTVPVAAATAFVAVEAAGSAFAAA